MSTKDIRRKTPYPRLLLRVTLVLLASCLGWLNGLGRVDQLIYDRTISLFSRPAPQDVLIVTIDDEAIDTLGRWPWPRSLHAMLLERLQGARAVGLDIVFSETDAHSTKDDNLLTDAVREHGRVVLPMVLDKLNQPTHANLPISPLAEAAAGLGYINVDPDDDGVLRSAVWANTDSDLPWKPFALAMLEVGGDKAKVEDFLKHLPRTGQTLIPYTGGPGHFKKISYLSVLRGELTPEAVKDKYVLVGAWATGLGDIFPSPVSHDVNGIAGVEVIANLLHGARQNTVMVSAQSWQTALASALPVLLLCLALPRLSPRKAIFYSLATLIIILFSVALILYIGHLWIPPAAALLGVAMSYPLWSWRSQEAALRYMSREMKRLRIEYPPVLDENIQPIGTSIGLSLDQQTEELDRTLAHVRNLRRFVTDGLDGIPDVNMVIDANGLLKYRNRPAVTYFMRLGVKPPRLGQAIIPALEQAFPTLATNQVIFDTLHAHDNNRHIYPSADTHQAKSKSLTVELRDRADHDLLFRCSPIRTATGAQAGQVVTISDVSAIRQAERQREQTLQFISHDMRAPQNSILALVELHRQENSAQQPSDAVFSRIESLANRTLQLVDNFIELTRAESMNIADDRMDLVAILHEIADDFWATTRPRKITLHVQSSDPIALTRGDTSLIRRALSNLIDNAIKYSPDDSAVHINIAPRANTWDISIQDAGPGVPLDEQRDLFKPFFRTKSAQDSSTDGSGLGLAFVHTVAQRHGGNVTLRSTNGKGSCFTFSVPFSIEDDTEDGDSNTP